MQRTWSAAGGQTNADGTSMLLNVSSTGFFLCPADILLSFPLVCSFLSTRKVLYITKLAEVKLRRGDQSDDEKLIERDYASSDENEVYCTRAY